MNFLALDKEENLNYGHSLQIIASLSKLFSQNNAPFLHYRIMENLFCSCFKAKNLSRSDSAYDAKIGDLGVGLKTFVLQKNSSIGKIAEFNKNSAFLKELKSGEELALALANLRNERMALANEIYGIKRSLYHIVARRENKLIFFETDYEKIEIENIKNIKNSSKSLSFDDGKNEYYFNHSKSVLQRKFYVPTNFSSLDVKIIENPLSLLLSLENEIAKEKDAKRQIAGIDFVVLPLFSTKGGQKFVPKKSGLNQWHAGGRKRDFDELYIPVPMQIHKIATNFFPPRDEYFTLLTPLNESLKAKLCQDNAKALMTNPNKALANWLLRRILKLKTSELATFERLENLGFDSVIIEKIGDLKFSIDIMPLNSYEKFLNSFTQ